MSHWGVKKDPITAAARSQLSSITIFLLTAMGLLMLVFLVHFLRTDWSMVMPYYRLDSADKVRAFDSGRGSLALMDTADLETDGEEVVVTSNYTHELMIGGAVGPVGQSSRDTTYLLYYRYFPDSGGALVVLAGPKEGLADADKVNVYKFSDDLVQSFFGTSGNIAPNGMTLHFFSIETHRQPVWAKYAVLLLFIALTVSAAVWLPGFTLIQRFCRIGKQIRKYGDFKQLKEQILKDYEQPLYTCSSEYIGRRFLLLSQYEDGFKRRIWYFSPMNQVVSVKTVPDPAGVENCFQIRLSLKDGNKLLLYSYAADEAGRLEASILMYSSGHAGMNLCPDGNKGPNPGNTLLK